MEPKYLTYYLVHESSFLDIIMGPVNAERTALLYLHGTEYFLRN